MENNASLSRKLNVVCKVGHLRYNLCITKQHICTLGISTDTASSLKVKQPADAKS